MLTEKCKLVQFAVSFSKTLLWNFGSQKCGKSFLSKIEVLTPWFSETAKVVIAKFVVEAFL